MNNWLNPLPLDLVPSSDPDSFRHLSDGSTCLPLQPHPGSFACVRKHHTHEGVDLYAPEGTVVSAVEKGVVVLVEPFTGVHAGTPWWHDTQAVFVEGASGVVVYGELLPVDGLSTGQTIEPGEPIGHLTPVLRKDKGRPGCMLHIELHTHGARQAPGWDHGQSRPATLLDPTNHLLEIARKNPE